MPQESADKQNVVDQRLQTWKQNRSGTHDVELSSGLPFWGHPDQSMVEHLWRLRSAQCLIAIWQHADSPERAEAAMQSLSQIDDKDMQKLKITAEDQAQFTALPDLKGRLAYLARHLHTATGKTKRQSAALQRVVEQLGCMTPQLDAIMQAAKDKLDAINKSIHVSAPDGSPDAGAGKRSNAEKRKDPRRRAAVDKRSKVAAGQVGGEDNAADEWL